MTTIEQAAFNAQLTRIRGDWIANGLPDHMWGGMKRYLLHGIEPGDFMGSVIRNDLSGAVGRADIHNIHLLPNYVRFLYNGVPGGCWGSPERYTDWIEGGGFMGGKGQ